MKTYRKNYLWAALLVAVAATSCSHKEEMAQEPVLSHSFCVDASLPGLEQEADSKGYLGSYVSATWTKGDSISVVNLTKGKVLGGILTADSDGTRTTFSGTVSGTIAKGDVIALLYPSLGVGTEADFGTRSGDLSCQSKEANVPLVTYASFTAEKAGGDFSDLSLSFYYLLSYIKINLAGLPSNATASTVTLNNMPTEYTISINSEGTGFNFADETQKSAAGTITLAGPYTTSSSGAMAVAIGVMPSNECSNRDIVVNVEGKGNYLAPMISSKLVSHKYYNTIINNFDKISFSGVDGYGAYDLENEAVLAKYDENDKTIISGKEGDECDFTFLNTSSSAYWSIKGIPSSAVKGTEFNARVYSYGFDELENGTTVSASVKVVESDGAYSKLWIKSGNYMFIVRK